MNSESSVSSSFFKKNNPFHAKKFASTPVHRASQRGNVGLSLLNSAIIPQDSTSLPATVTIKMVQVLCSMQAICRPKITKIERTAHAMQASIALAQTIILCISFMNNINCPNNEASPIILCKYASILGFLYNAILLSGWVPAELNKEPHERNEDNLSLTQTNTIQDNALALSQRQNSANNSTRPQSVSILSEHSSDMNLRFKGDKYQEISQASETNVGMQQHPSIMSELSEADEEKRVELRPR